MIHNKWFFFFEGKIFCFQDILIFKFLVNVQNFKSATLSRILLYIYFSDCFFRILRSMKIKFC